LSEETVAAALARLVKSKRWLELDQRALWCGRETAKTGDAQTT